MAWYDPDVGRAGQLHEPDALPSAVVGAGTVNQSVPSLSTYSSPATCVPGVGPETAPGSETNCTCEPLAAATPRPVGTGSVAVAAAGARLAATTPKPGHCPSSRARRWRRRRCRNRRRWPGMARSASAGTASPTLSDARALGRRRAAVHERGRCGTSWFCVDGVAPSPSRTRRRPLRRRSVVPKDGTGGGAGAADGDLAQQGASCWVLLRVFGCDGRRLTWQECSVIGGW